MSPRVNCAHEKWAAKCTGPVLTGGGGEMSEAEGEPIATAEDCRGIVVAHLAAHTVGLHHPRPLRQAAYRHKQHESSRGDVRTPAAGGGAAAVCAGPDHPGRRRLAPRRLPVSHGFLAPPDAICAHSQRACARGLAGAGLCTLPVTPCACTPPPAVNTRREQCARMPGDVSGRNVLRRDPRSARYIQGQYAVRVYAVFLAPAVPARVHACACLRMQACMCMRTPHVWTACARIGACVAQTSQQSDA